MQKKLKKFISLSIKFSVKFILKETPYFVKLKILPIISNLLKNKFSSILERKEKDGFEASKTLRSVCKYLVTQAKKYNHIEYFHHINEWSKQNIQDFMKLNRFKFLSSKKKYIYYLFGEKISYYSNMADWRNYILFIKN